MATMLINEELDMEWSELILKALHLGIPEEEIRKFLNQSQTL